MHKLILWINRIFFPKRCGFCAKSIPETAPLHICDACLSNLPTVNGSGKKLLKGHIDFVLSPFCYSKGAKRIIIQMKFHEKPMLAATLGAFMAERLATVCDLSDIDIVIPVPMTPQKESLRGYNTATLLAREVARRCNLQVEEKYLRKRRETKVQSRLEKDEKRMLNVRDAFVCKAELEDANVLLVDDIFTSGHTLKNCAKALKVAGAGRIIALTAAQARARESKTKVHYQRVGDFVFRQEKEKEA